MRVRLTGVVLAGLLVASLAGCAAPKAPLASAGNSSNAVQVTGDFGKAPKVNFSTPLKPQETQCTELIAGTGERVQFGEFTSLGVSLYNGTTGKLIQDLGYPGSDAFDIVPTKDLIPGLAKALTCARLGSRVVAVAPSSEMFGAQGNADAGIGADDSIVMVIDVLKAFPSRATGTPVLSADGFPAVVLAPDGRPGITVPHNAPPITSGSSVETLLQGNGAEVKDGDTVVVQYTGVNWATGKAFDSSWEKQPATFTVSLGSGATAIPGFAKAIIGKKVGSQVGVIVSPADGYGEKGNDSIAPNSTLFFVIDILGIYASK